MKITFEKPSPTCVFFLLIISVTSFLSLTEALTKPSGIKLVDNQYTGIVVAIHEDEPQNNALIESIKSMFVRASSYLYHATKKRAFFKEVTILIPSTWSDDPSYGKVCNESFRDADVIIAPPNPRFSPKEDLPPPPYTNHYGGCGKQGIHIHFTSRFLLDRSLEDIFGDFGRLLVHEWGHFRWGLFNEYPDSVEDDRYSDHFYLSSTTGLYEPVACPQSWNMSAMKYTGIHARPLKRCNGNKREGYERGCLSVAEQIQPHFTASIMMNKHLSFEQVIHFCDNDIEDQGTLHNSEANNKHNRLCEGRSSWEVMREHDDFNGDRNPPREIEDVRPSFKVIRENEAGKPIVLVLDTSGSMSTMNRSKRLQSVAKSFLISTVAHGCRVGIVDFDSSGKILSHLREINSETSRQELAGLIVGDHTGGTCIGCGVMEALKIIPANETGKIILITDGRDSKIADLMAAQAECIKRGGKFYLQTDDPRSRGALQAYSENSDCGRQKTSSGRISVFSNVFTLTAGDSEETGSFEIDPTIGRETTLIFSYFVSGNVNILGIAEAGKWWFTITSRSVGSYDVTVSVSSLPTAERVPPIKIRSYLSGTEAEVTPQTPLVAIAEVRQGFYPIVNARVIATVERPVSQSGHDLGPVEMILRDDGIAPFTETSDAKVPNFNRECSAGASYVSRIPEGWTPELDIFPPSTIFDLTVTFVDAEEGIVNISCTSPGGDMDSGKASSYVILRSNSTDRLKHDCSPDACAIEDDDVLWGNLSLPSEFGTKEEFSIRVPLQEGQMVSSFFFAVFAVDESGNRGKLSNMVQVILRNDSFQVSKDAHAPRITEDVLVEAPRITTGPKTTAKPLTPTKVRQGISHVTMIDVQKTTDKDTVNDKLTNQIDELTKSKGNVELETTSTNIDSTVRPNTVWKTGAKTKIDSTIRLDTHWKTGVKTNIDTTIIPDTDWNTEAKTNVDATLRADTHWKTGVTTNIIDTKVRPDTEWITGAKTNIDTTSTPDTDWKTDANTNIDATRPPATDWKTGANTNINATIRPDIDWKNGFKTNIDATITHDTHWKTGAKTDIADFTIRPDKDWKTGSPTNIDTTSTPEINWKTGAKTNTDAKTRPGTDGKAGAKTNIDASSTPDIHRKTGSNTNIDTTIRPNTHWKTGVKTNIDATIRPDTDWNTEAKTNIEATIRPDTHWKTNDKTKLDATGTPDIDWKTGAETNIDTSSIPDTDWKTGAKTSIDATSTPNTDWKTETKTNIDPTIRLDTNWKTGLQTNIDSTTRPNTVWKTGAKTNIDSTLRPDTNWKTGVKTNIIDSTIRPDKDWKTGAKTNIDTTSTPEINWKTSAKTNIDAKSRPGIDGKTGAKTNIDATSTPDIHRKTGSNTNIDTSIRPNAHWKTGEKTNIDATIRPGTDWNTEAKTNIEATIRPDTDWRTKAKTKINATRTPDIDWKTGAETNINSTSTPDTDWKTRTKTKIYATRAPDTDWKTGAKTSIDATNTPDADRMTEAKTNIDPTIRLDTNWKTGLQTNIDSTTRPNTVWETGAKTNIGATLRPDTNWKTGVKTNIIDSTIRPDKDWKTGAKTNIDTTNTPDINWKTGAKTNIDAKTRPGIDGKTGAKTNIDASSTPDIHRKTGSNTNIDTSIRPNAHWKTGGKTNIDATIRPGTDWNTEAKTNIEATIRPDTDWRTKAKTKINATKTPDIDWKTGAETNINSTSTPDTDWKTRTKTKIYATRAPDTDWKTGAKTSIDATNTPDADRMTEAKTNIDPTIRLDTNWKTGLQTNIDSTTRPNTVWETGAKTNIGATLRPDTNWKTGVKTNIIDSTIRPDKDWKTGAKTNIDTTNTPDINWKTSAKTNIDAKTRPGTDGKTSSKTNIDATVRPNTDWKTGVKINIGATTRPDIDWNTGVKKNIDSKSTPDIDRETSAKTYIDATSTPDIDWKTGSKTIIDATIKSTTVWKTGSETNIDATITPDTHWKTDVKTIIDATIRPDTDWLLDAKTNVYATIRPDTNRKTGVKTNIDVTTRHDTDWNTAAKTTIDSTVRHDTDWKTGVKTDTGATIRPDTDTKTGAKTNVDSPITSNVERKTGVKTHIDSTIKPDIEWKTDASKKIEATIMLKTASEYETKPNTDVSKEIFARMNSNVMTDDDTATEYNVMTTVDGTMHRTLPSKKNMTGVKNTIKVGCETKYGWKEFNRHCYKLLYLLDGRGHNFTTMLAACKEEGPSTFGKDVTRVADITSKAENDFVANIVAKGNRAWIGAKRTGNGESFVWMIGDRNHHDPTLDGFTNWKPNEPNNKWNLELCVEINRGPAGGWNDIKCRRKLPIICKYSLSSLGRVLVHEWGHFRWGLFNEYPDKVVDGRRAKYFYRSSETGLFEPVACPRLWRMMALKYTGNEDKPYRLCQGNPEIGYERNCLSIVNSSQPEFSASIMFGRLNLPQITHFCDNNPSDPETLHNYEANNKHNRLCGGRSSWEVMREHDDFRGKSKQYGVMRENGNFRDNVNAPRQIDDVQPTIKVVRVRDAGRPIVLVLDTSGSMSTNDRKDRLASAVRIYLTSTISEGCRVGIIDFDDFGKTLSTLRDVDSESTRQQLAGRIVADANGGTCIGCGIESALNIIPQDEGGKIILITDGQDGNIAKLKEMKAECRRRGTIVDSIAYSNSVQDIIRNLAVETGGKIYLQKDDPTSTGASDAFNDNSQCGGIASSSTGRIVPGSWTFTITNVDNSPHVITVSVSSLPSSEEVEPIVIKSFLSGTEVQITGDHPLVAYAEVTQGFYPIIQARVIATIERPRTADGRELGPVEVILKDNGGGFDITKNDGIYTKAFTGFTGIGYYGISVRVENNGEAIVLKPTEGSRIDRYINPEDLLNGELPSYGNSDPLATEPLSGNKAPNFTRSMSAGAAHVSQIPIGWTPESDILPPSRILDLSVSSVDFERAVVDLTFTAPGDDFDSGVASSYVILQSSSFEKLRHRERFEDLAVDDTSVKYGSLSSPSEFGTEEEFTIRVPIQGGQKVASFFFAVFAEDEQECNVTQSKDFALERTNELDTNVEQVSCNAEFGWKEFNNHCYKMLYSSSQNKVKDCDTMLAACKREGVRTFGQDITGVADITSKAENDFVANIVARGNHAWIGAKRNRNVFPAFSVKIHPPSYILPTDESISVRVDLDLKIVVLIRYTYGKPVRGRCFMKVGVHEDGEEPTILYLERVMLDGHGDAAVEKETNILGEGWFEENVGRNLYIEVTVVEDATGHSENASDISVKFADVKFMNGKPAPGVRVRVRATATIEGQQAEMILREAQRDPWNGDGIEPLEDNTNDKGQVNFRLYVPRHAINIRILLETVVTAIDNNARLEFNIRPFESPNGNEFLVLEVPNQVVRPEFDDLEVEVFLNSVTAAPEIFYFVVSRGKLMAYGKRAVANVDGFTFPVSYEMVPSVRVVAYYISDSGQIIADSVWIEVERACENPRMFDRASPYLYNATRKRAFFKEVSILVPPSWPDDPSYESATSETFEGADIIVAPRNPRFSPDEVAPSPYTKHFEGCGKQAIYIHLTSHFLLDNSLEDNFGDFGRVLVHEWGHFRWGLFNEYPDKVVDGRRAKYFYRSSETGLFEPVACPRLWRMMTLKYTGNEDKPYRLCQGSPEDGYERGCVSIANSSQPEFSASIMFGMLNLPQITHFCDNNPSDPETFHNSEANNKLNRLCGGRSSWEVMREHDDFRGKSKQYGVMRGNDNFRDNVNAPRQIDDVQPTIKVVRVREAGRPVVLVLDTSGSMSTNDRANRLASAVRTYLTSTISEGCRVGVIDFDDLGKTLSTLRDVDSESTRQQLAGLIVGDANGGTCIGCGIESALNIIPQGESGKIILITDGQDGNIAKLNEMQAECKRRGTIVDSIAYSDSAQDNIRTLADETGINVKFCNGVFRLMTRVFELAASDAVVQDSVNVDSTVGKETNFIFSYFKSNEDESPCLLFVKPGSWTFTITNLDNSPHDISVSVSSLPSSEEVEPIVIKSFLSGTEALVTGDRPLIAYAEVTQGFYAIIQARVIATIERPRTADGRDLGPVEVILKDNGGGFDITKNDGIYTKSFTGFTGIGYYGISVRVENNGEAIVMKPTEGSRIDPYINPEDLLNGELPSYGNPNPLDTEQPLTGNKAPSFTRTISAGAARVSQVPMGWTPESDILPPSRILDLSVSSVDFENAVVNLTFTAPGDDFDSGVASSYVILQSSSFKKLRHRELFKALAVDDASVKYGSLSSPSEFGTEEEFTIRVPIQDGQKVASFFFAVFAEDEQGNRGVISNIVQAILRKHIPDALESDNVTQSDDFTLERTNEVDTNAEQVSCNAEFGWKEFNNHCYKMLYSSSQNKVKDFNTMLEACKREGVRTFGQDITWVADITSEAENDFVANIVARGNRAWIGAKRNRNERDFKWITNDGVDNPLLDGYTNWESDEPNNQSDVDSCVQINRGSSGTWNDVKCRRRLPIICKYSLSRFRT
ncbi:Calcium-activated chloride channel regulator 1 [Holothuria leucospilota]|uniref:Calcium-activated chloride channel regulator 1 n=1 Tax=Holothuria leucospilota TaxID=206669 RepID=A0A9Q1BLE3_HOLLE|nr:Calcium-activated chloride channel regulator 1 [Holothuria leucospilota]